MAIQEKTIEKSIKFFYENPDDPEQNYWVVYQNTENGPSIALSQSDMDCSCPLHPRSIGQQSS